MLITDGDPLTAALLIARAARRNIPLTVIAPQDQRLRQRYKARFALIRPDQHVAWRGDALPADIDTMLMQVTGFNAKS